MSGSALYVRGSVSFVLLALAHAVDLAWWGSGLHAQVVAARSVVRGVRRAGLRVSHWLRRDGQGRGDDVEDGGLHVGCGKAVARRVPVDVI